MILRPAFHYPERCGFPARLVDDQVVEVLKFIPVSHSGLPASPRGSRKAEASGVVSATLSKVRA